MEIFSLFCIVDHFRPSRACVPRACGRKGEIDQQIEIASDQAPGWEPMPISWWLKSTVVLAHAGAPPDRSRNLRFDTSFQIQKIQTSIAIMQTRHGNGDKSRYRPFFRFDKRLFDRTRPCPALRSWRSSALRPMDQRRHMCSVATGLTTLALWPCASTTGQGGAAAGNTASSGAGTGAVTAGSGPVSGGPAAGPEIWSLR